MEKGERFPFMGGSSTKLLQLSSRRTQRRNNPQDVPPVCRVWNWKRATEAGEMAHDRG